MRTRGIWNVCFQTYKNNGSRTIAPEENCHPTPKLTLTQPLALTRSQIFSGPIFWLPPNPKTNSNLVRVNSNILKTLSLSSQKTPFFQ